MASLLSTEQAHPALRRQKCRGTGDAESAAPRLSVIIVNYRQWKNTAALVKQVRSAACTRRGEVELMVVDNHSPPSRLMSKLRRCPGVSLRRWGRNRGFARAVNEGCRLSRGGWFLLLNPDVSVTPEFVQDALDLSARLERTDPAAGIVGFRLRNSDGSHQLSAGPFPTLAGTLAGLCMPRRRRKYQIISGRRPCTVPWVTGCCLLVRADCWRELGGFDEDFFLYYEDVDLCRRARASGWSVWYEPNLAAVHHNPMHRRPVPDHLRLIVRHSLLTYAARHWPRWQTQLLAGIVRLEGWARKLWTSWRGDPESAGLFQQMSALACEIGSGAHRQARKRLERVVRKQE